MFILHLKCMFHSLLDALSAAGMTNGVEDRQVRGRSRSSERWTSLDERKRFSGVLSPPPVEAHRLLVDQRALDRRHSQPQSTFSPQQEAADKQRHKAVRQDSYLAAVKTIPGPTGMYV